MGSSSWHNSNRPAIGYQSLPAISQPLNSVKQSGVTLPLKSALRKPSLPIPPPPPPASAKPAALGPRALSSTRLSRQQIENFRRASANSNAKTTSFAPTVSIIPAGPDPSKPDTKSSDNALHYKGLPTYKSSSAPPSPKPYRSRILQPPAYTTSILKPTAFTATPAYIAGQAQKPPSPPRITVKDIAPLKLASPLLMPVWVTRPPLPHPLFGPAPKPPSRPPTPPVQKSTTPPYRPRPPVAVEDYVSPILAAPIPKPAPIPVPEPNIFPGDRGRSPKPRSRPPTPPVPRPPTPPIPRSHDQHKLHPRLPTPPLTRLRSPSIDREYLTKPPSRPMTPPAPRSRPTSWPAAPGALPYTVNGEKRTFLPSATDRPTLSSELKHPSANPIPSSTRDGFVSAKAAEIRRRLASSRSRPEMRSRHSYSTLAGPFWTGDVEFNRDSVHPGLKFGIHFHGSKDDKPVEGAAPRHARHPEGYSAPSRLNQPLPPLPTEVTSQPGSRVVSAQSTSSQSRHHRVPVPVVELRPSPARRTPPVVTIDLTQSPKSMPVTPVTGSNAISPIVCDSDDQAPSLDQLFIHVMAAWKIDDEEPPQPYHSTPNKRRIEPCPAHAAAYRRFEHLPEKELNSEPARGRSSAPVSRPRTPSPPRRKSGPSGPSSSPILPASRPVPTAASISNPAPAVPDAELRSHCSRHSAPTSRARTPSPPPSKSGAPVPSGPPSGRPGPSGRRGPPSPPGSSISAGGPAPRSIRHTHHYHVHDGDRFIAANRSFEPLRSIKHYSSTLSASSTFSETVIKTARNPVGKIKDVVAKFEGNASTPAMPVTPIRALGRALERPCPVSSAGLSGEARRMMYEARQKGREAQAAKPRTMMGVV